MHHKPVLFLMTILSLVFAGNLAADDSSACEDCPTARKVGELLTRWEAIAEQSKAATDEQRAQVSAQITEVAQSCPVGSRVGATVATVRDVLAFVATTSQACAERCPLENADPNCEACAAGKELKATRGIAVGMLHELANHAAGAGCGTCCTATCDTEEVSTEASDEALCCDASAPRCPIRLASRLGALEASWTTADREVTSMTSSEKSALQMSFATLAKDHPAAALLPASVSALAEGFEKLSQLHASMNEWARSNPEIMSSMPESGRLTFMMQVALIDEARLVLAGVTKTMGTLHSTSATSLETAGR